MWLALASQSMLDAMEKDGGVGKWGSCVSTSGEERVVRTEVEGWGVGGVVGAERPHRRSRRPGAGELTREEREEFEVVGREVWKGMEELREEWEGRLERKY